MIFEDNDNFRPEQGPYSGGQNGGGNHDNDFGAWLLIGIMFLVAWPVGLILLIKKLSDNPQRTKKVVSDTAEHLRSKAQEMRQEQQKQQTRKTQTARQSAVKKVTQTPQLSDKGAKVMKIIGIVLAALGGVALLGVAENWLGYAIEYNEWWYFLRQMFYPTGLLAGGLALLIGGGVMKKRMRRFSKYLACAGTRNVIPLSHLMKAANVRESKAERDLELMIEKGMWGPTAYLDRGNDILFRSQEAADDYFAAKRAAAQKQTAAAAEETAPQEKEGYESMLQAIRRANDRIDDPVLTAKIHRLEAITGQIFKVIREEPAKKNKANTFLNYYLPTTQKLLDSYADFEETGVSGQNLDQAKVRIEETMDNIIAGFEHQLDELYRDAAMDIDSDIRVMETMLRRDTATAADDFGLDGGTAVQTPDTEIE